MSEISFLREQLRKGHSDDPWHGPATTTLLWELTALEAAARPVSGAHSVWEVVLHMISWQNEVRRRLGGKAPGLPEEGDWPEPSEISDGAWERDQQLLEASLDDLLEALAGRSEEDLERTGGSISDRDPSLGTGVTHRAMVHGLTQHNAYHSGQIALLRKALRSPLS
jgi:uncharacterized damage-inducible protein DinB